MKQGFKMVSTLCIIAILSAVILAKVYEITKPKIDANEKKAIDAAIYKVVSATDSYKTDKVKDETVYKCYDRNKKLCGIAFIAEGVGYQDVIKIMVGTDPEFDEILAIEVLDNSETPGLGNRITTPWFENQFNGLNLDNKITVIKKAPAAASEIQAITGATISSQAVVDIVTGKINELKE
jgi:electron transport complex protein RnfG